MSIRTLLKYCTYYSGMSAAFSLARGNHRVWNLDYQVSDPSEQNLHYVAPNLAVSPSVFERHVAFLARRYRIISLDEVVNWISGAAEIGEPTVVITFNDGYRDNYLHAYPVLKSYGATHPSAFGLSASGEGKYRHLTCHI